MKILSRNVNGIRAIYSKWFIQIIKDLDPDIICLQETKAFLDQCPQDIKDMGYNICRHAGTKPWYAGTAILSKHTPDYVCNNFVDLIFHEHGRVTQIAWWDTTVFSIYFPNGGSRADGTEMLTYKLNFYSVLMNYLKEQEKIYKNVIVVGDYNICHKEIDIARPKENQNSIGFLPIERDKITEFLNTGYIDVFRYLYPEMKDQYTRRSYRANAKANNVGRRIDYACINESAKDKIIWMQHFPEIGGSDHCPIMLEVDL